MYQRRSLFNFSPQTEELQWNLLLGAIFLPLDYTDPVAEIAKANIRQCFSFSSAKLGIFVQSQLHWQGKKINETLYWSCWVIYTYFHLPPAGGEATIPGRETQEIETSGSNKKFISAHCGRLEQLWCTTYPACCWKYIKYSSFWQASFEYSQVVSNILPALQGR